VNFLLNDLRKQNVRPAHVYMVKKHSARAAPQKLRPPNPNVRVQKY